VRNVGYKAVIVTFGLAFAAGIIGLVGAFITKAAPLVPALNAYFITS
jgi:hypothetical protein